jgi:hypothetical protein
MQRGIKTASGQKRKYKKSLKLFGKTLVKTFNKSNFRHIIKSFKTHLENFKDIILLFRTREEAVFRHKQ